MILNYEKEVMEKIFLVTEDIQDKFPELYALLSETPLFLSYKNQTINDSEYSAYLSSLEKQRQTFYRFSAVGLEQPT